mmetsp:Transcript_32639/g.24105  ORF Transcript_32639/g.24105 Transcript_32639/m.24105 type:complete len:140 (+) Transcript_32639:724-1143(+)
MNSYTVYQIQTQSKLPNYEEGKVYEVLRRFSDFEWLLGKLQENEHYKGMIIPPLPQKKYLGNLSSEFVELRRQELETFLRVIASHAVMRHDLQLKEFLTFADQFEKYKTNPSAYERAWGYMEYIPSVKNISMNSVKSAI